MEKQKAIRLRKLQESYDTDLFVRYYECGEAAERLRTLPVHRDDNYLFVVNDTGYGRFGVDFHIVESDFRSFFHVCPGQIHHDIDVAQSAFWLILVSPSLVPAEYATILNGYPRYYTHAPLTDIQYDMINATLAMLAKVNDLAPVMRQNIRNGMLNLFLAFASQTVKLRTPASANCGESCSEIAHQFCMHVSESFARHKSPADYARQLNISPGYLAEAVKSFTGQTPTDIIRETILVEAKRQLCFTSLIVKEIAYALGYDDEAYFSRFFKKYVGLTPMEFRAVYRK